MTLSGLWVRDDLLLWHKAAAWAPDDKGRYLVRCLASAIDVNHVGLPGAGAQICDECMDAVEREESAG